MLCGLCEKVFTFEGAGGILWMKQNAIQQAVKRNFDAPQIKRLQRECERYRSILGSRRAKSLFPSPWGTTEPIEVRFAVGESYPLWESGEARHWHELKKSATSTGCGLCERLVAMLQYQTTTPISESAIITCVWFEPSKFLRKFYVKS